MHDELNPLRDGTWEQVTFTVVYLDQNKVTTRKLTATWEDAENHLRAQDPNMVFEDKLPTEVFREWVKHQAEGTASSPMWLTGPEPHQLRVLPASAILEVLVSVDNLASRIVIPA
jgi:hypothetical protein